MLRSQVGIVRRVMRADPILSIRRAAESGNVPCAEARVRVPSARVCPRQSGGACVQLGPGRLGLGAQKRSASASATVSWLLNGRCRQTHGRGHDPPRSCGRNLIAHYVRVSRAHCGVVCTSKHFTGRRVFDFLARVIKRERLAGGKALRCQR